MMVHVTAPASLPAGYTFEAEINGDPDKIFTCEVPPGGIEEGQIFLTPLPQDFDHPRLKVPIGSWKDGLFGCFNLGICHPALCCSLFCPQIAMAQIMSRLQLSWLGEPGLVSNTKNTFTVVLVLAISYYVYSIALQIVENAYSNEAMIPSYLIVLKFVGNFLFALWVVYSLCRTRETMRARYQIPEQRCHGCEDLCCSLWCSCCVTAQMLRHTGEYENYPGTCFSTTGHPSGTPLTV